jgi:DHA1 family tetracycline resistance protein-like MFS transporter
VRSGRPLPTLFLIVFVDLVGFGLIIPLLPFYAEHFQARPATIGLLMASYSLAQFVAAPVWGRMSDHLGRRPCLLVSLGGAVVAYGLLAFAQSFWALFAARAFAGLMAGNIAVAFAYAADVTTPVDRARGMGLIGAAFGLGFIFGPAIGGILAGDDPLTADFRTPSLAAAGLSALALALAVAMLPESLTTEARSRHRALPRADRQRQFRRALTKPAVGRVILISFLATLVFAGMESMFALWSRRQFGWGPEQNGYLFAFVGAFSALIQGGLIGRLANRLGELPLVWVGAALLALGMLLIPQARSLALLLPAMTIVAAGFALMSPALNTLLSLHVGDAVRGGTMGVGRSATTLARVVGPAAAGALFEGLGKDWPFYAGAIVMLAVVVLSLRSAPLLAVGADAGAPAAD